MKNICENCKFWNKRHSENSDTFGECKKLGDIEDFTVLNISSNTAEIITKSDFGCNKIEFSK